MKQAAVCIIENSYGAILLLQRKKSKEGFGLPGGKVDPGETILNAAMREVLEETGLIIQLTNDDIVGVIRSAIKEYEVTVYYKNVGTTILPTVVLSPGEHIGYCWTKRPKAGIKLAGNTKKMIELWPKKIDSDTVNTVE